MGSRLTLLAGEPRKIARVDELAARGAHMIHDATGELALECALLLGASHRGDLALASQERFRPGVLCSLRGRLQPRAPEVEVQVLLGSGAQFIPQLLDIDWRRRWRILRHIEIGSNLLEVCEPGASELHNGPRACLSPARLQQLVHSRRADLLGESGELQLRLIGFVNENKACRFTARLTLRRRSPMSSDGHRRSKTASVGLSV